MLVLLWCARGTLSALVLVVPEHRLPELDLVPIRIHDPRELAVLVRLGSLQDFHAARTELRQQLAEVVDTVVDHEGGIAGAEPLAVSFCNMPHRQARSSALSSGHLRIAPPKSSSCRPRYF